MSALWKSILRRTPALKKDLFKFADSINATVRAVVRGQQELFVQDLLRSHRYANASALAHFEHQVYSQNGEDDIIAEIFRRIAVGSRTFIEIGVGDGLENNSAFLLSQGWTGTWMEGSPKNARAIRRNFTKLISSDRLRFIESFITAENVAGLIASAGMGAEVDLLSIDIDRNTYFIWEALPLIRARLVVVEYNATLPPWLDWKVQYRADEWYDETFYYGASLKSYEMLGQRLGYSLVGCDLHGVNAFFVRNDLVKANFAAPFTAEALYEPARYWLIRTMGHPRGYSEFNR